MNCRMVPLRRFDNLLTVAKRYTSRLCTVKKHIGWTGSSFVLFKNLNRDCVLQAYRAEHGVGFHPLASACFLNCDVLTHGCARYCESSSMLVIARYSLPSSSLRCWKYSVSVAPAPYGTPFFRR